MPTKEATDRVLDEIQTHVIREFIVSKSDFDAVVTATRLRLLGPQHLIKRMENAFRPEIPGIPGVENTDFSEFHGGEVFSILIHVAFDNAETHRAIREAISSTIAASYTALAKPPEDG